MPNRTLVGKVVSMKQAKTIIVEVSRVKTHPLYHKKYKVTKRYAAHFEGSDLATGEMVLIQQTRPLSKTKRFSFVRKLAADEAIKEAAL